mgnify:CR=1 FL=1
MGNRWSKQEQLVQGLLLSLYLFQTKIHTNFPAKGMCQRCHAHDQKLRLMHWDTEAGAWSAAVCSDWNACSYREAVRT